MTDKLRSAKKRGTDATQDLKKVKKAKLADAPTKETVSKSPIATGKRVPSKKAPRKKAADYFEEEHESQEKKAATQTKSKKGESKSIARPEEDFEGFDSDDDVIPAQALDLFGEDSDSDSESEGIHLDDLPPPPQENLNAAKALTNGSKSKVDESDGTGTLYIGHIPHGFYEQQMRAYFSQFGTIKRLRLSRNRKTGAAKHYAFVEFESSDVADIVQKAMDKYLMFGHILQVRRVPKEQLHENLWKGANRRFKKIPWGDIQARKNAAPQTREVWRKRISREEKRREKKKAIMQEYGYEFDLPKLKKVDDVPSKVGRETQLDTTEQKTITDGEPQDRIDDASNSKNPSIIKDTPVEIADIQSPAIDESKKATKRNGKKTKVKKTAA